MRTGKAGPGIGIVLAGLLAGGCVSARAETSTAPPTAREADAPEAIEAGRRLFFRCAACHTRSAAARARTGPHLEGLVGRRAASLPGFRYTSRLKGQPFTWTRERLGQWLREPQAHVPGMCVPFAGFARKEDRQALVAYLANPAP